VPAGGAPAAGATVTVCVTVTGDGPGAGIGSAAALGLVKQMIPAIPTAEPPMATSQVLALWIISPPPPSVYAWTTRCRCRR
jgi:hypothetical protein